jgi:glutamate carboxypeptidase
MNPTSILEYYQRREKEIVRSIHELVEIESPSFNVGQSVCVADWLESECGGISLDLAMERVSAEKAGEHVVIRAFSDSAPGSLLLGHTDTVHPIGTNARNPTRTDGDSFYGCGIFDMKANVVLILEVLRFFSEADMKPEVPINILLSCDEEVGSATGRPLVESEASRSSRCFVFEPSFNGKVKTGRKGTGMFTVKAHGRPAHAGLEPEKGASAVLEISRQIDRAHDLNDPINGTTVNVCTVKGGTTTNVIPEYAEATVDVRFNKASEAERIEQAINGLTSFDERVSVEVCGGINRPPMERTPEVLALYEKARDLGASFGYDVGETQVGGASDGNFVAALGVPVLDGLGIAGDGAHTLEEHILISDIAKRATLITLLLANGG